MPAAGAFPRAAGAAAGAAPAFPRGAPPPPRSQTPEKSGNLESAVQSAAVGDLSVGVWAPAIEWIATEKNKTATSAGRVLIEVLMAREIITKPAGKTGIRGFDSDNGPGSADAPTSPLEEENT